jgi:hypothetical protein
LVHDGGIVKSISLKVKQAYLDFLATGCVLCSGLFMKDTSKLFYLSPFSGGSLLLPRMGREGSWRGRIGSRGLEFSGLIYKLFDLSTWFDI